MGKLDSLFKQAAATQPEKAVLPKASSPFGAKPKVEESKPEPDADKPKPAAAAFGGLKFGTIKGKASGASQAKGVDKASPQSNDSKGEGQAQSGDAAVQALSADAVPAEAASHRADTPSGYADETPATKPSRDVPADAEDSVKRFIELLDNMHGLTPEPQLASDVIRNIMIELKSNPQYIKHVAPGDVRIMIRTMRENMGLAKVTKAEKATARKKKVDSNMMDDLASLGVDLANLA